MNKRARVIAFYLPQYHPVPENDKWWGKGFTEWTNVGKAKPLFRGHYQPRVPADLGYYDLRLPEVREAQAEMAKNAGIEGFMYWHYWFGNGRRVIDRPFNEVLHSKKPDFPFCLGWANHTWSTHTWETGKQYQTETILIKQEYLGVADYVKHFECVLPAFRDERYLRVNENPIFLVYAPVDHPEMKLFINVWRDLAVKSGIPDIHFVGQTSRKCSVETVRNLGFDAVCRAGIHEVEDEIKGNLYNRVLGKIRSHTPLAPLNRYQYKDIIRNYIKPEIDGAQDVYPAILPNYDHSPRSGRKGMILEGSTPELFGKLLADAVAAISAKEDDKKIILLRSWNEWAEGNYVEPDLVFGRGYLDVIRDSVLN